MEPDTWNLISEAASIVSAYLLFPTPRWRNPVSFQAYIILILFQPHNQPGPYHTGSEAAVEGLLPGARHSAFKCQLDLTRVTCLWESHPTSENLSFSTCKMGASLEPILLTSQGCGDHQSGRYNVSLGQNVVLPIRNGGSTQEQVIFYLPLFNFMDEPFGWPLDVSWLGNALTSLIHSDEECLPCSKLLLLQLFHARESPGKWLKCRFWFRRPERGLEILHFSDSQVTPLLVVWRSHSE